MNTLRAIIPVYDRSVRLAPQGTTGGGDEDAVQRQIESFARFSGLFPGRVLSDAQRERTLQGERYDQLDQDQILYALDEIDRLANAG